MQSETWQVEVGVLWLLVIQSPQGCHRGVGNEGSGVHGPLMRLGPLGPQAEDNDKPGAGGTGNSGLDVSENP